MSSQKTITNKEDIDRIKKYFIAQDTFAYDRHLLFFTIGINTPLKPKELSCLKWTDILYNNNIVKDYIAYNGYKFYLNRNCKNAIMNHIDKWSTHKFVANNKFVFEGNKNTHITYNATNKVYQQMCIDLGLNLELTNMSLHKTFIYWQIYYCNKDYVKMSKLYYMTARNTDYRREKDINAYAEYDIHDDMIYINDVNL